MALYACDPAVARAGQDLTFNEQILGGNTRLGNEVVLGVAAHAVSGCHPLSVEDISDSMGRVAVNTGRNHVGLLFPQFPADYLSMDLFDPCMTSRAGLGDPTG